MYTLFQEMWLNRAADICRIMNTYKATYGLPGPKIRPIMLWDPEATHGPVKHFPTEEIAEVHGIKS